MRPRHFEKRSVERERLRDSQALAEARANGTELRPGKIESALDLDAMAAAKQGRDGGTFDKGGRL